ncbi:protein FAR1-RELATED SEQUENCE 6-like [Zingiber officinale]|uniref:protein FAR1-RELATED SEQUENCE 6-like n=1 Tax=Zingiber officinale TaxID=94328 RepID=UPI001C4C985C|nr:protein FAR1-RELATED SEQUENCE 6-like [Zingiber officinale]
MEADSVRRPMKVDNMALFFHSRVQFHDAAVHGTSVATGALTKKPPQWNHSLPQFPFMRPHREAQKSGGGMLESFRLHNEAKSLIALLAFSVHVTVANVSMGVREESQRDSCYKIVMEQELLIEGDVQVLGDSSSSNTVDAPQVGMYFSSEEEVRAFYKSYAQGLGFGISKLGSKKGDDGQIKYFSFGCSKNGKTVPRVKNSFYPRACSKTDCKAKINITVQNDELCVITSIQLEHNHALSPRKSRHFRCNKVLDSQTKRKLELNDQAGITLSKSFQSFVVEAGGYENLSFDERKCRNYVAEARRLRLGNGDAEALNNYFCRMQCRNSNFFYVIDVDEDSRIRNIFWADARCRAACDSFSDVVTFDTTYLTNSYDMPFAPFVGVNHHGESILLGCGLISKEDSETFIWLFKSWLACMRGRAPRAIITDQCKAMEIAILEVFPDSHHRLCLWHIMKKLPAKFSSHADYKLIKRNLKNIVYNSLTSTECDSNWKKFIKEFNLEKNDWLNSLYEIRHKWMPVYVKDKFWAGMSTSQRSESMNAFFDDYVHSKTTLKQFVEQYDNALKSKIEKEDNSDFTSFNSIIPVISGNPIEKQFQSVYTNKIFKLFQNELRGLMFCNTSFMKEEGSTLFFEVMETVYGKDGTTPKEISFWVQYSELQCEMKCLCRLFEFRGIVCRHLLSVLVKRKVTTVPENYILERWRKDIKRGYQGITNIYDDSSQHAEERRRYNNLQPLLQEVGQLGSKNDERCFVLIGILKEAKKKFMDTNIGDSLDGVQDSNIIHEESRNESKKFHSPLKVRSRERPPTKKKQSKIEQIEKRAKAKSRKKGSIIDRKQDDLSNIEEIDKSAESQRLFRLDKELLVPNDVVQPFYYR